MGLLSKCPAHNAVEHLEEMPSHGSRLPVLVVTPFVPLECGAHVRHCFGTLFKRRTFAFRFPTFLSNVLPGEGRVEAPLLRPYTRGRVRAFRERRRALPAIPGRHMITLAFSIKRVGI